MIHSVSLMIQYTIRMWTNSSRNDSDYSLSHFSYAATRGLFYSHVGWIFYKPRYEKMDIVDREDLEKDPG